MKLQLQSLFTVALLLNAAALFAQGKTGADSTAGKQSSSESYIRFDDTRNTAWTEDFEQVGIKSGKDGQVQKAFFYKTRSGKPKPLVVSLHTWSGDFRQKDELAPLCKGKDVNYIHPDFRGPNKTSSACCSELALSDIDDAITFAIKNAKVDTAAIYVIGVSGGGYATLSTFMKSRHNIKKFSAWVPITNLEAWYQESTIMKSKYAPDILACTDSKDTVNLANARQKSPVFMKTPAAKLKSAKLFIYAGIYDGIQGSVPITHSINFYNKLLTDLSVKDKTKYVSVPEKLHLLEFRRPLGNFGNIGDRKVCLKKEYGNARLTLFEGNHEMLPEYALDELLKNE
ncbi:prolyl oligopeptidase family serine peptidase [Paraflavisolibacter sp. H34]|uniref:alpha/beta hydrolase family protein n=1 Tax=Huijunlia imazamoxiresistens TaxID=3127457 RepID=UPI00301678B7